jgi:excinuclease ABC subunit B
MRIAIDETARRRELQKKFNAENGITPVTIEKAIRTGIEGEMKARRTAREAIRESESQFDQGELIRLLEEEMLEAAKSLEFERAAQLRDKLNEIKGVPTIRSASSWDPEVTESDQRTKIWQPKSKGRKKGAAK